MKDSASTSEELELELEALDIADEPMELEGADEAENEELAKKLLDEQGEDFRAERSLSGRKDLKRRDSSCIFYFRVCVEQEDEEANTGSHLKLIVDAFIQQLPNCVNRDLIDKVKRRFTRSKTIQTNELKRFDPGSYVLLSVLND